VTGYGLYPLLSEEENCTLVEVTETEVDNSVHSVPKLDTLILVFLMVNNKGLNLSRWGGHNNFVSLHRMISYLLLVVRLKEK
jgi:hypothetical protein